jgi:hypothetical protein
MHRFALLRAGRALLRLTLIVGLTGSLPLYAAGNRGATISGSPPTAATVGTGYSFTPTYTVPHGDTATFLIFNKPSWASFDRRSGRLTGTPGKVGVSRNVRISLSAGRSFAWLPSFSITVSGTSSGGGGGSTSPPTISGQPPTSVNEGSSYSFTPTAHDSNGTPLAFSVVSKPAWATFNTTSGMLTGTPAAANVGNYSGIVISVSDGKSSASLPSFSIAVNQTSNGAAELSWSPPTSNTDGSAITNLAGYHIHYGTQKSNLTQTVAIANPGVASYTVTNLSSGTWYFALSDYNSAGEESALSNVSTKTVN